MIQQNSIIDESQRIFKEIEEYFGKRVFYSLVRRADKLSSNQLIKSIYLFESNKIYFFNNRHRNLARRVKKSQRFCLIVSIYLYFPTFK